MFKHCVNIILVIFLVIFTPSRSVYSQIMWNNDTLALDGIHREVLNNSSAFEWLRYLCKTIGHRLSGTPSYEASVHYFLQIMDTIGLDTFYTQSFLVPHWQRGEVSEVRVAQSPLGSFSLRSLALGNSVSTPNQGIVGDVIIVHSIEELEEIGRGGVQGKIVFFNRSMPRDVIQTFHAYGKTVDQRYNGPKVASELGAVACLVRSVSTRNDDNPHTGSTFYEPDFRNIPALAIGMQSADQLANALKLGKVSVWLKSGGHFLSEKMSHNVIGEIRGTEYPDEVILVAGHLDSWDQGEGAHDDGTGCVHALDVLHTMKRMNYKPKRTIRCVLYSNEENGLRGGAAYAAIAKESEEKHIAALESDRGGFTPRGFSFEGDQPGFIPAFRSVGLWEDLLLPYGLQLQTGGSGADIKPLQPLGTLLIGFLPDSQRYFDFHHAATDVFEAVNERELLLGSAAITSLIFLMDKYGLGQSK
jgi:carboxypeptidase Q